MLRDNLPKTALGNKQHVSSSNGRYLLTPSLPQGSWPLGPAMDVQQFRQLCVGQPVPNASSALPLPTCLDGKTLDGGTHALGTKVSDGWVLLRALASELEVRGWTQSRPSSRHGIGLWGEGLGRSSL